MTRTLMERTPGRGVAVNSAPQGVAPAASAGADLRRRATTDFDMMELFFSLTETS